MPKLTQSFVKSVALPPGKNQLFFMDDELTGFGLRLSARKKVFYIQMRLGRRVLKRKIGEYGVLTVDQARKGALLLKAQLLNGKDPYQERKQGPSNATLEHLFDEYANEVRHRSATLQSIEKAKKAFGTLEGQAFRTKPDGRSLDRVDVVKVTLPSWLKRTYRSITQDEVLARFDIDSNAAEATPFKDTSADYPHRQPALQISSGRVQLRYEQISIVPAWFRESGFHPQDGASLGQDESPHWVSRHDEAELR